MLLNHPLFVILHLTLGISKTGWLIGSIFHDSKTAILLVCIFKMAFLLSGMGTIKPGRMKNQRFFWLLISKKKKSLIFSTFIKASWRCRDQMTKTFLSCSNKLEKGCCRRLPALGLFYFGVVRFLIFSQNYLFNVRKIKELLEINFTIKFVTSRYD